MKEYMEIVKHYEKRFEEHGDSHLGVDWPNREDAEKRYKVMLEVIKDTNTNISLLDLGCGAGHLYEYIQRNNINTIDYSGLDISEKFTDVCRSKFKNIDFYTADILDTPEKVNMHDYIVMNGVFTEKLSLSFDEMFQYFREMVKAVYLKCNKGIAFNVMSKHVDWERDDLFHLPFDLLAAYLVKEISRNFVIRNDYGLYEYTVYLYK